MAKDKKGQKESAQEQKAPAQAQHSAKERPRLRRRLLLLRRFLLSLFVFCHFFPSTSSHGFGVVTGS